MFFVDFFDCIICYGKRNNFKVFFILLLVFVIGFIINNVCSLIVVFILKVFEIMVN